jgi:hypothetical protein
MARLFSFFGMGSTRILRMGEGDDGGGGSNGGGGGGGDGGGTGDDGSGGSGGGSDGGGNPSAWDTFIQTVPEEHRENPSILKFKNSENPVAALANAHASAVQLIGRDKIPVPKTDEEFRAAFKRLGMPETPDEYELDHGLENPTEREEFELKRGREWLRKTAHELGLTKKQAEGLYKSQAAELRRMVGDMEVIAKEEIDKGMAVLRDEYGHNFESRMTLANRAIEHVGGREVIDLFRDTGVGRHPAVARMMVKVGQAFAEDMGIDKSTGEALEHSQTLKGKAEELMHSPAYSDKTDPAHKATVAQVTRLFEKMHGTQEHGKPRSNVFNA